MEATQVIIVENKPHTISLNSPEGIHLSVYDQTTSYVDQDIEGEFTYTFTPAGPELTVKLTNSTYNGKFSIENIQLEPLPFNTSYITTTDTAKSRGDGKLTVPVSFSGNSGTVFLWFAPNSSLTTDDRVLVELGDIRIKYDNVSILVADGANTVLELANVYPTEKTWYPVLLAWNDSNAVLKTNSGEISTTNFNPPQFDHIAVGFSETYNEYRANALIDNLYVVPYYEDDITKFIEGNIENALVYLSFDGTVSNFDNTVIELTPANKNNAPVIIEKADGTIMTRVAFIDKNTYEYVPYATEKQKCNGTNVFKVAFDELETENFQTMAIDQYGNHLHVIDVNKNQIIVDIDPKQYANQYITLIYQPKNSYTVRYKDNDVFEVVLGKHDGQPIKITYETEEYSDVKLLPQIDLNAMNNPNHDGFVYITHDVYPIENINCTVYPRELRADGNQKALIIIDCRDRLGNIVSDVTLEVKAAYGQITKPPAGYIMEVPIEQQAGRHIFEYTAPRINASFDAYLLDNIVIKAFKDNELQMSTATTIKLYSV